MLLNIVILAALIATSFSFSTGNFGRSTRISSLIKPRNHFTLHASTPPSSGKVKIGVSYEEDEVEGAEAAAVDDAVDTIPLSPEEQYKKDKLAEIAEKKSQEVFLKRTTGKYECQACGYVYNVAAGLPKKGIAAGTPFEDIEKFRCPECGANKKYFIAETETVSGFKENQKFGFGGNAMTGEMKGAIIYGGLFLGFALFLGGYLLE